MAYNFNCVFTGLCGFVLDKPLPSMPTRARVLLPEGRNSAIAEGLSPHYAMLIIPTPNLMNDNGFRPHLVLPRRNEAVYFISGVELTFDFHGEGTPSGFTVDSTSVANPKAPVGPERSSLALIAQIDRGAPGAKNLHADSLGNPPHNRRIASRVRLNSGHLFVRSINQGGAGDQVWDFNLGGSTTASQVFAEDVVLRKQTLTTNVRITGTRHSDGATLFRLDVGASMGEFDITVLVSELEGLFDIEIPGRDPDKATDIKLLYRLSTAWNGTSATIGNYPIPERNGGGGIGRPIHCPRAMFTDNSGA